MDLKEAYDWYVVERLFFYLLFVLFSLMLFTHYEYNCTFSIYYYLFIILYVYCSVIVD